MSLLQVIISVGLNMNVKSGKSQTRPTGPWRKQAVVPVHLGVKMGRQVQDMTWHVAQCLIMVLLSFDSYFSTDATNHLMLICYLVFGNSGLRAQWLVSHHIPYLWLPVDHCTFHRPYPGTLIKGTVTGLSPSPNSHSWLQVDCCTLHRPYPVTLSWLTR